MMGESRRARGRGVAACFAVASAMGCGLTERAIYARDGGGAGLDHVDASIATALDAPSDDRQTTADASAAMDVVTDDRPDSRIDVVVQADSGAGTTDLGGSVDAMLDTLPTDTPPVIDADVPTCVRDAGFRSLEPAAWEPLSREGPRGSLSTSTAGLVVRAGGTRIVTQACNRVEFDARGGQVFLRWQVNNGYMGVTPYLGDRSGMRLGGAANLTTDRSFNGSYVLAYGTWYYTRFDVTLGGAIRMVTAEGNYDSVGGRVVDTAQGNAAPAALAGARACVQTNDNYEGTSANVVIGEWLTDLRPSAPDASCGSEGVVCPEGMIYMPGGTFTMGAPTSETGSQPDERPQHQVTLSAFCLARTEVTVAEWTRSGLLPQHSGSLCNHGVGGRENHPMNCIDWTEANAYCQSLGQRLPTEAEWEYAASVGGTRRYPWGDAPPDSQLCWNGVNPRSGTCAVGSFSTGNTPNGLVDLSGNVWEWVSDWYGAYESNSQTNPNNQNAGSYRVYRGGGRINGDPARVRARDRYWSDPSHWYDVLGVRCASGTR